MSITLLPQDRSEKYVLWSKVVTEVENKGAKSIIIIAEAWTAPFDSSFPDRAPGDSPDRFEVLSLVASSSNGDEFSIESILHRQNGKIEFEPNRISVGDTFFFLAPIRNLWLKRKCKNMGKHRKKYELGRNDLCLCKSGKKFKNCCEKPLSEKLFKNANMLFNKKDFHNAEIAFRAWLTQYIIWYNEHTLPFTKVDPEEAKEITDIDIKALVSICFSITKCYKELNEFDKITEFLDKCLDIIDDNKFRLEIQKLSDDMKN